MSKPAVSWSYVFGAIMMVQFFYYVIDGQLWPAAIAGIFSAIFMGPCLAFANDWEVIDTKKRDCDYKRKK